MIIEIYGKESCGRCKQAELLCKATNTQYVYVDLGKYPEAIPVMRRRIGTEVTSIPQVFANNKHVGDYDALYNLIGSHNVDE